jgi:hypothetical protein
VFSSSRIDIVFGASPSSDVAGYRVLRNGATVGTVDLPNTPRYSDNGLAASTSYSYTVEAVDSAGNVSLPTTAKSAKTLAAGAVIIARGPYLSDVTANSAIVSWWTNLATTGVVGIAGGQVTDPAGSVQHHAVTVSGLAAGTSYPYTVTSGAASGSGTLRTAAAPGQSFTFAAIGDFGGGSSGETQNGTNIASAATQFIQTVGDNIYPSSGLPDPNFTTTYSDFDQRFFKPLAAAAKSQAFFPANGNKEYYGDGEFWNSFPMPGTNHSWFSYDWGDAHILVVDSEQPFAPGSAQYAFAQSDLAAHQSATWRIVAIQRPPYSSTTANSSSKPVQQYLVPLFQAQHVQLVLSGNSHNYERTYPLVNGAPAAGGVTYVVTGAGGNGFNKFPTTAPPAYSAYRESDFFEYAKVSVSPTALTVDAVRADTDTVFDTTTISAGSGGGDTTPPTVPGSLKAAAAGSSAIDLSWTAGTDNVGVTGYRVYRDGASTAIATVTSGTTYADTGLGAATTHSYTVTAIDAAGNESGPSNSASATTASGGGGGGSGPQLVRTAAGTTATSATATFGAATTGGDLLVLSASLYTGATNHITSITDSAGSTWKAIGAFSVSGHNSDGELWYAVSAPGVRSVTIHTAAATAAFQVQEYSGTASAPLDVASGQANTSTAPSAGPVTVPAGDLVVGFVGGHASTQAISLAAPFASVQPQTTFTGSGTVSVATGSTVRAGAGSATLTATTASSMYWAAGIAAFKPAS